MNVSIVLLTLVMIINGLTNFILFKLRSLKIFYWVLYPFAGLFVALIVTLIRTDKLSSGLASIYFIWLIYDLYFFLNLWRLNTVDEGK